jgi:caa(3)-type oxidase subunit IV
MSESALAETASDPEMEHLGHHPNYVKIWAVLCVLLAISVLGPTLGIKIVTLVTAFGIAVVKAYLVAKNFMHLNVQPRYAVYLLLTMLVFMLLLFAGVSPDVLNHEGDNWVKTKIEIPHAPAHGPAAMHH